MKILLPFLVAFAAHTPAGEAATSSIFGGPTQGDGTQFLLGMAEAGVGYKLVAARSRLERAISLAEKRVILAQDLTISISDKESKMTSLTPIVEAWIEKGKVTPPPKSVRAAAERINLIAASPLITTEERTAQILAESNRLATLRARQMMVEDKLLAGENLAHGFKVLGGALLFLDAASRLYVWHVLSADPTLSPAATYLYEKAKNIRFFRRAR